MNDLQRIPGSSDDLVDQLVRNSQCQKTLATNGDVLLGRRKANLSGHEETTDEETFRFDENIRGQIENIDQYRHGRYAVDHQDL